MKKRPLKQGYRRMYTDLLAEVLRAAAERSYTDDSFRSWVQVHMLNRLKDEARRM